MNSNLTRTQHSSEILTNTTNSNASYNQKLINKYFVVFTGLKLKNPLKLRFNHLFGKTEGSIITKIELQKFHILMASNYQGKTLST